MKIEAIALALLASLPSFARAAAEAAASAAKPDGAALYARMCSVCHGPNGEGYKADNAPALNSPAYLASANDGFLFRAIAEGRAGSTMSAWGLHNGGPLSPEDIQAVIAFMRGWSKEPAAKLDEKPLSGDAAKGAARFAAQCASCHGQNGVGGTASHLGDAVFLASASNGFLRDAVNNGRPGTPMTPFGKAIGDAGVEDLVAYLRGLQAVTVPAKAPNSSRPPPLPLGPVPLNPRGPEPDGFNAYPGMTAGDVIQAQLDRRARFAILDARAPSDYTKEHIAGAVSVPFYDPSPYFSSLPKDVWLVCYCACPHAESGQLAQKLQAQGFKKVTVLDEGFGYWKSHKYPTRQGSAP